MANFKQTVITKAAHNLIAKSLSGSANINFTRVATSKYDYKSFSQSKLESLTSLEDIKQYVAVDKVEKIGEASVNVSVKITNANITEGYYVNTIGLFAIDPEEGEILYSVTVAETADYFPADNGVNCSGINLDLVTEVSNASNVNITVNYAGYATNEDIEKVNSQLNDIMNERGYVNTKIITGLDLNTIIKSGIYVGNNLINAPQTNVWYTLEVFNCSNDDYVIQRIMGFADGGTTTFERRKNLTKWTEWQPLDNGLRKLIFLATVLDFKGNNYTEIPFFEDMPNNFCICQNGNINHTPVQVIGTYVNVDTKIITVILNEARSGTAQINFIYA